MTEYEKWLRREIATVKCPVTVNKRKIALAWLVKPAFRQALIEMLGSKT